VYVCVNASLNKAVITRVEASTFFVGACIRLYALHIYELVMYYKYFLSVLSRRIFLNLQAPYHPLTEIIFVGRHFEVVVSRLLT
jgi:hypothetical protein